jgi:hypothetical protein
MTNADLRGDNLKIVRWWIPFTKPGYETILLKGDTTVDYPLMRRSWVARRLRTSFQGRLQEGRMKNSEGFSPLATRTLLLAPVNPSPSRP